MPRRFEIQDIASQNQDGVTFRALDKSTNQIVSLRRFFPFGQDEEGGEGLDPQEGKAFSSACQRLSQVSHPALRKTIYGDTDPIDGMPYLVTEWIDGPSLADVIGNNSMDPNMILGLVRQAIEVCMVLSTSLESEAVWIDTKLESIIVSNPEVDPTFSFRICPFKWLGTQSHQKDLTGMVSMVEALMGWRSKLVSDQAGLGLGGWLKVLRQFPEMSLQDALCCLPNSDAEQPVVEHQTSNHTQHVQPYIVLPSANPSFVTKKSVTIMAISACVTTILLFFLYQNKQNQLRPDIANANALPPVVETVENENQNSVVVPIKEANPTENEVPDKTTPDKTTPEKTEIATPEPETISPKPKLWTPAELATTVWYDAADASVITASGGAVSQWGDKSGNANHATQGNATYQPTTGTRNINGLNVLDFTVDALKMTTSFELYGKAIYCVAQSDTASGAHQYISDSGAANKQFRFKDTDLQIAAAGNPWLSGAAANITGPSFTPTNAHIAGVIGEDTLAFSVNGTETVTANNHTASGPYLLDNIGARSSSLMDESWDGVIGEMIVLDAPTLATRQKIEGYLAHKWGLQASLPADHPYKLSPPASSSSEPESLKNLPKTKTASPKVETVSPKPKTDPPKPETASPNIKSWSLDEITTTAWYDAADATTITANGEGLVTQWNDKSGNSNHATQSNATYQPTTGTRSLNGRNVLDLAGDWMSVPIDINRAVVNKLTVFAVFAEDDTTGNYALFGNDNGGWDRFVVLNFPANSKIRWGASTGSGTFAFDAARTADTNNHIISLQWVTGAANGSSVCLDGATRQMFTESAGTAGTTTMALGALNPTGGSAMNGYIAEFIMISNEVDLATQQKIEGYLAHKWGLQASLPADHPYKLAPPIPPVPSILTSGDTEAIKTLEVGAPVTLQGIVKSAKFSSTGKSMYLSFSDPVVETDIRIVIHGNEYDGKAFTEEEFAKLIGKKLEFSGTVYIESFNDRPPFVKITEKKQIKLVPQ